MFVEYHTDLIYDKNFLFFGSCLIDGFHQHIHYIVDGIDGGQGACQILHSQFSGLGGQCVEMISCFCDEIQEECFLFFFCCRGQFLGNIEVEQFVIQVTKETFTDEFFCHQNFFCIIGEACEGTGFLHQFVFFSADSVGFVDNRFYGCFQLFCQCIQICFFFSSIQFAFDEFAYGMVQVGIRCAAFCQVFEGVGQIQHQDQGIDVMQDAGEIFFDLFQHFIHFLQFFVEFGKFFVIHLMGQNHALLADPFCYFGEIFAVNRVFLRAAEAFKGFQGCGDEFLAFACKSRGQGRLYVVIVFISCHIQGHAF